MAAAGRGADLISPEGIPLPPSDSSTNRLSAGRSANSIPPEAGRTPPLPSDRPPPLRDPPQGNNNQEDSISWVGLWQEFVINILESFPGEPPGWGKLGPFWQRFLPLFIAVGLILDYFSCPAIFWPHHLMMTVFIPWGVQASHGKEEKEYIGYAIGYAAGFTLLSLLAFTMQMSWAILRFLGFPPMQKCYNGVLAWGWYRAMQLFTIAAMGWKVYTCLGLYLQLASKAKFTLQDTISNLFGPRSLRFTQVSACRLIGTFERDFYFPLCATTTLEPYDLHRRRLFLPWTQDSLTNAYYKAKDITPTPWTDWEWYHTVIIWILFAWLYFYFFKFFSYTYTEFPKRFYKTVIFLEKQVASFLLFQTLRFFLNVLPRFVFNLPTLSLLILQYPFRILRTQTTGKQAMWGMLVYVALVISVEYTNYRALVYPKYEFQRQLPFGASETTLVSIWAVTIGAGFIWWFQAWAENIMYWDYPKVEELTRIRIQWRLLKRLRRIYQYYDGFWRHNEEKRRGIRQLNYQVGFNWGRSFALWLILPAVFIVGTWNLIHISYFVAALVNVWFPEFNGQASLPDLLTKESPKGYSRTYIAVEFLFWRLGIPAIVTWIVNEVFIEGKLDSEGGTFVKIRPEDQETF